MGKVGIRWEKSADDEGVVGTLCCETAEEAKALVPSLVEKISDADLEELLKEITNLRNFVE